LSWSRRKKSSPVEESLAPAVESPVPAALVVA
jgi:hypothetical protein